MGFLFENAIHTGEMCEGLQDGNISQPEQLILCYVCLCLINFNQIRSCVV